MNRTLKLLSVMYTFLYSSLMFSQTSVDVVSNGHSLTFKTQFIQIKDDYTYGLTYSGPNLALAYKYSKNTENGKLVYTPEVSFGGVFNKGAGFAWRFKPIDLFYGHNIKSGNWSIGGYMATDYQWQQYSELQGGRLYWFSAIEFGPKIEVVLPFKSLRMNMHFSNSLLGFTSRPDPYTETHFYAFNFSEFFSVAHKNLTFGTLDAFSRSKIGIDLKHESWNHLSIAYFFEYYGYYDAPQVSFLSHSINLNWKI